jgi:L-ascorbate metabolism protein UlaG (beta-lactamase superfamily)
MAVRITYHGHSCFSIDAGGTNLLIDPFITGNSLADVRASDLNPHYILVSHAQAITWETRYRLRNVPGRQ